MIIKQLIAPWMRWFLPTEQRRHLKLVFSGPDTRSALWFNNYVQALFRHWDTYVHNLIHFAQRSSILSSCIAHRSAASTLAHLCRQQSDAFLMAETEDWFRKLQQHPRVKLGQTCLAAAEIKGNFAVCSSTWGWIVLWSKAGVSEPSPQGPQSGFLSSRALKA